MVKVKDHLHSIGPASKLLPKQIVDSNDTCTDCTQSTGHPHDYNDVEHATSLSH